MAGNQNKSNVRSMTGLKRHTVSLSGHDDSWHDIYEDTKTELTALLGDLITGIQHIGSTAIGNIKAKPIIDIAILIERTELLKKIIPLLEGNGFEYRGDSKNKGGHLFVKCSAPDIRTHHIHIIKRNDPQWENFLRFRNALNRDSSLAAQYEKLKEKLAAKYYDDRKEYTKCKNDFIKKVLLEIENCSG